MTTEEQIAAYIDSQSGLKREDMAALHQRMLVLLPEGRLWFSDGTYETGKVVSNPTIGYGQFTIRYKDGSTKEFFQIGVSGNTTGISVYIMGLEDKKYLPEHFGNTIGKASVTGYCIKFKKLSDINLEELGKAVRYGVRQTSTV